ncbi:hypothetical protein NMY22_g7222 [Coprinellus aureogranulatus]|nr:hypothetical protein NMY22_g7222 [Coprinellus aureogranulatus]
MAPSFATVKSSNLSHVPTDYAPVAVFVGGTSGIGQGMAEALAKMTGGKATIVLVGRNSTAAESIIASLPPNAEGSSYEFVKCDVTLMRNVVQASKEILAKHSKINYLVLTTGFFSTKGYEATEEGIERKLAAMYYARWKFTHELLPALQSAKEAGQEAKVFSVLAAGRGAEIDVNDLGMQKSFSVLKAAGSASTYNDLMTESFAERAPGLTFIHSFPGTVVSNFLKNAESPFVRALSPVLGLVFLTFARSRSKAAEYLWNGVFTHGAGAFRTGPDGEDLGKTNYHGTEEQRKALWEHTYSLTNVPSTSGA